MLFSLQDIGLFILFCLFMTAGVIFIILMLNVIKVVNRVNKVIETNTDPINKSLAAFPETIKNVNEFSLSAKETVDNANIVIGAVTGVVEETVSTVEDSAEGFLWVIKSFGDIVKTIQNVWGIFEKR